jgi:acyl carrier protein
MQSQAELKRIIRAKVLELAVRLGGDVTGMTDDDILLKRGLLDSASVFELLVWLEMQFDVELDFDGLSLDNFGSVTRMAEFIGAKQAG